MQPAEFIENLGRHYSKRHETEAKQIAWTREMIEMFKGTDPLVLAKTYELIRDEHEERAFPLPATIKRFIGRAADLVYPEHLAHQPFRPVAHTAPDPESVERVRALVQDLKGKLTFNGKRDEPAKLADVSRPAFEAMQRNSPNRALHMTEAGYLTEISKRMMGDKE